MKSCRLDNSEMKHVVFTTGLENRSSIRCVSNVERSCGTYIGNILLHESEWNVARNFDCKLTFLQAESEWKCLSTVDPHISEHTGTDLVQICQKYGCEKTM